VYQLFELTNSDDGERLSTKYNVELFYLIESRVGQLFEDPDVIF